MNDPRIPILALAIAIAVAAVSRDGRTESDAASNGADVLSPEEVIRLVVKQNPTLAAAMGELRRAALLEEGEEHRYPFTFLGDAKALRNGAPAMGPNRVTFPEATNLIAGAELRRKLPWGTDLALRIEATRQESFTLFTFGGVGGGTAGGTPVQTLLHLGPGYGGSVRLGVTQPLLRGAGRDVVQADLNAARESRGAAQSTLDRTSSQTLLDALTAYWELYYASRAIDIQRRSIALARRQRDETAARIRTGGTAPVEELTFETRIATLEEELTTVEADERARSAALARAVGDASLTLRRAEDSEPPRYSEPPSDARRVALESSFEVAEQKKAVTLAEVQSRIAGDALRSRLDVDAYVQAFGLGFREGWPVFEQIGTLRAVTAQVALTFEAPLDGTRQRTERTRAELAVKVARDRLDAVLQQVVAELDAAQQRDAAARRRIDLSDRTLEIARTQLGAEEARFRTGSATALQVREAEEQVRSAELRTVRARVDLALAHLTIAHLTGTLIRETAASR
jgi:outer membrane protein